MDLKDYSLMKVKDLRPYKNNSRIHKEPQIQQIADSIEQWGFTMPILIDDEKTILAGHGRLMAAQRLKMAEVPVLIAKNWSEEQKKAYVIADNKLTENSFFDPDMLKVEINNLTDKNFDIDLLGFSEQELSKLFDELNLDDIKEIDENFAQHELLLTFDTEEQLAEYYEKAEQEGIQCKIL